MAHDDQGLGSAFFMTHSARKTLGFQLTLAARLHRAKLAGSISQLGLFPGQEKLLAHLIDKPPMPIGDLSRVLGVRPPTISKSVNRLVAEGLVERMPSENDSRIVLVRLTTEGRERLTHLNELVDGVEAGMTEILGEKDAKRLRKLLRRLTRALSGHEEAAGEDVGADEEEPGDVAA
jgi:DNA-binding MarR family transcriptional regulator